MRVNCHTRKNGQKIIIGNSMMKYAQEQLAGVTQIVAKSNTMVAV